METRRQSVTSSILYLRRPSERNKMEKFQYMDKNSVIHVCDYKETHCISFVPACTFCHLNFKNVYQWQAHMITFIHKKPSLSVELLKEKLEEAIVICKFCRQDTVVSGSKDHRCYVSEITRLENIVKQFNKTFCPLMCILCKKITMFQSQALLQTHLLTRHSPTRDPWRCNLCNAIFKTTNISLHEAHAIEIHGPELSLIYWKLNGEQAKGKLKTESSMKYVCALSHYSKVDNKKGVTCPDEISDVFELTLHTICNHGIISNLVLEDGKVIGRPPDCDDISCKYCGQCLQSKSQFNDHILSMHSNGMMVRKDFVLRKLLLHKKVVLNVTCLLCVTVFGSTDELQIHLMVTHGTEQFGLCGMCGEDLLNFANKENEGKIDRIHWKSIQYHEKLHFVQFHKYKETGVFNTSLKSTPKLYESDQQLAEELEIRKNVVAGPLFTNEQIAFLKALGMKNYESQVIMEINDR